MVYAAGLRPSLTDIDSAVTVAMAAGQIWRRTPLSVREACLQRYALVLQSHTEAICAIIALETGKPIWECNAEVQSMIQKISITIAAYQARCSDNTFALGTKQIHVKHCPHGVMAVLGPFNFPGHLPLGHIAPAVLAGNSVVFKPSIHTPQTAFLLTTLWQEAGLPDGVLNLVFGGAEEGRYLVSHPDVAGVCFTGSAAVGIAISQAIAHTPWKIVALEMGGNNPLVVVDWSDMAAVVDLIVVSAYQTAGQRCTCARRLIVVDTPENRALLHALVMRIGQLIVDKPDAVPVPFMGPVISVDMARSLYDIYLGVLARGGQVLVPTEDPGRGAFLHPALVDVTDVDMPDVEYFGPILWLTWVPDFQKALFVAGNTAYGLVAGLVARSHEDFSFFTDQVRAGVYSHNCPTIGASSAAPFGGVGMSGNHRPSAYYAADYCAYPTVHSVADSVRSGGAILGIRDDSDR